jgi:hypothetical protein
VLALSNWPLLPLPPDGINVSAALPRRLLLQQHEYACAHFMPQQQQQIHQLMQQLQRSQQ